MFPTILDMLGAAFDSPVSETDYLGLVRCIREYENARDPRSVEQDLLVARGWPITYDVCEHLDGVRFALVFNSMGNARVRAAIAEWKRMRAAAACATGADSGTENQISRAV